MDDFIEKKKFTVGDTVKRIEGSFGIHNYGDTDVVCKVGKIYLSFKNDPDTKYDMDKYELVPITQSPNTLHYDIH